MHYTECRFSENPKVLEMKNLIKTKRMKNYIIENVYIVEE